jgi:hypothetical protein
MGARHMADMRIMFGSMKSNTTPVRVHRLSNFGLTGVVGIALCTRFLRAFPKK